MANVHEQKQNLIILIKICLNYNRELRKKISKETAIFDSFQVVTQAIPLFVSFFKKIERNNFLCVIKKINDNFAFYSLRTIQFFFVHNYNFHGNFFNTKQKFFVYSSKFFCMLILLLF